MTDLPRTPTFQLNGKKALVTGASRGIGLGGAMALAEHGAHVVMAARNAEEIGQAAQAIRNAGYKADGIALDVAERDSMISSIRQHGPFDILFNNAGVPTGAGPFLDIRASAWDIQFDLCIKGAARFCQAVIPSMRERGGGSIINNSSIWGSKPLAGAGAYVAAKAGMIGLTKAIAVEHGPDNIRCNAILPGTVVTEINDSRVAMVSRKEGISVDEVRARMAAPTSLKRLGRPEEIGALVAFLAGDAAGFITGAAIPIDGGVQNGL